MIKICRRINHILQLVLGCLLITKMESLAIIYLIKCLLLPPRVENGRKRSGKHLNHSCYCTFESGSGARTGKPRLGADVRREDLERMERTAGLASSVASDRRRGVVASWRRLGMRFGLEGVRVGGACGGTGKSCAAGAGGRG